MKINFDNSGGLIKIPVILNEKGPFYFHFDTGAKMTTISGSTAQKGGIKTDPDRVEKVKTAHKELILTVGSVDSLSIGNETLTNHSVRIHDHPKIMKGDIAGTIGHNFFQDYIVEIDYSEKTLGLYKNVLAIHNSKLPVGKLNKFRYIEGTHLVGIPTVINGGKPLQFILDTGAGGTIINADITQKLDLKLYDSDIILAGPGGTSKTNLVLIDELSTPLKTITNLKAPVFPLSHLAPQEVGGILGFNILRGGRLIIDYPNREYVYISH